MEIARNSVRRRSFEPPLAQSMVERFFAQDISCMGVVPGGEMGTAADKFLTDDFLEGAAAFLEKRRLKFKGN